MEEQKITVQPPPIKASGCNQLKALVIKNAHLQSRQICTNIIQILTPIIGLAIIKLIKYLIFQNIGRIVPVYDISIPFFANFPYNQLAHKTSVIKLMSCNQFYYYGFSPNATKETIDYIGYNNGTPVDNPNSSGLLTANKNILEGKCNDTNSSIPYFLLPNKTINEDLFIVMNNMSNEQLNLLQLDVDLNLTDKLPDGAFNISEANNQTLKFNVQSNDKVYAQYHKNDGVTKYGVVINNTYMVQLRVIEGQIYSEDLIAKAYFRKLFPKSWWFAATQFMPKTLGVDRYIERILDRFGCLLYPICLAVLLPMFMYTIVLEKEEKLLSVMRMNGMRMKYYWMSNFIFDMILYFLAVGVFLIFAIVLLDISVFKNTDPFTQFVTFLGWGYSQISLAFFFSVFTSKAQNATIMGYVISIWTTILAVALNSTLFEYPNKMPTALHIYPTFSFARLEYLMSFSCGFLTCMSSLSQMMYEAKICLIMIYIMSTAFLLIGLYLNEVLPQQYGVPSHPLFPLHYLKSLFCGKKTIKNDTAIFNNLALNKQFANIDLSGEDNDVKELNNVVKSLNTSDPAYNLIIKDIRKIYQGDSIVKNKLALKQFNLAIERGELFGLLGPNGAGKTSLISMLTGLYPPTYGNAWIASNSLKDSMDQVYLNIGICPQFDTLWSDLTVKEHLEFYGRLKGQSSKQLDLAVEEQVKKVKLQNFQHLKVRQLSGGMKRRLSVAISLVGFPRVVFLDEPTTGLDPENRRQLWNILSKIKGENMSIILTTHSMEEADVLCNRIGIITNGTLRCIGTQQHLKNVYGTGYHLYINCQIKEKIKDPKEINEKMMTFISKILPQAKLFQAFNGYFTFNVPSLGDEAEELFSQMEHKKEELNITDWGLSQCSMDDVFKTICFNEAPQN